MGLGFSPSLVHEINSRGPSDRNAEIIHSKPNNVDGSQEFLEITVIRASGLPECLGGTNPYVVVHIPSFGQTQTQTLSNTTDPFFGATLLLRSPLSNNEFSHIDDGVVNIGDDGSWTKVQFIVFNKNPSLSDDLIALTETDVGTILQTCEFGSATLNLVDKDQCLCGTIEVKVRRTIK